MIIYLPIIQEKDISTIDNLIEEVNIDLKSTKDLLKNTADIYPDKEGYYIAQPKSENPRKETLNNIKNYNTLSIFSSNLSNLKLY